MKVSFIVPAYNEEKILGLCLQSIIEAIAEVPACDAEIIVVNNASTDRTAAVAASFPGVRVVDEPKKGLVWARRAGCLAATGELLCNIDSDAIIVPGWLPKVIGLFSADPELLAVSGPYIYYDLPWHNRAFLNISYAVGYGMDVINGLLFHSASMMQGGNFVLRREALAKIGGFDTSIDFYGEDSDIGRRVRKVGKVIWTFDLAIKSSGRRFAKQGFWMTGTLYFLNFFWIRIFSRPFTQNHADFRSPKPDSSNATVSR